MLLICRAHKSYVFESAEGFSINFHKIDLKGGSSYIPTPKWLEIKKAKINPKNINHSFCFVYAATVAIFHKEIGDYPERISSKSFRICIQTRLEWYSFSSIYFRLQSI